MEWVVLKDATPCTPPPTCIAIGYVTVAYDNSCWLWYVLGVNELEGGVKVKFLHPCIPLSSFVYPNQEDIMDTDPSDILTQVAHTEIIDATTALAVADLMLAKNTGISHQFVKP